MKFPSRPPFARAVLALALTALTGLAVAASDTTRVVVTMKPGAIAAARAAIAAAGGRIKLEIIGTNAVAVEMPTRAVRALKRHASISLVEEDAIRRINATSTPSGPPYKSGQQVPYGIKMVQADQLPQGDSLTANRKVCIIDSGYDIAHEDLAQNDVTGEFDSGTGWWNTDENHHGTHVAGTIAAINNKGVGVVGVNPSKLLKLHIVKVFGADGWAYSSTLSNAARKCQAAGANIISMSLGGPLPNATERQTFADLKDAGILSIASSGNDGNQLPNYPASYPAVMSIGALDENKAWATFSQFNSEVELSAPGVSVLSTVPMGTGTASTVTAQGKTLSAGSMDGSPVTSASGRLYDFATGEVIDTGVAGKTCLIQRGNIDFAVKVTNCQNSGGVAAIIYNNVPGPLTGVTLGDTVTTIPTVTASDTEGALALTKIGLNVTVAVSPSNYALFDGTSMSTPHVTGVAAQVWSYFPSCTGEQIRSALKATAEDLGSPGRDNKFGYGLVQAKAAYDYLLANGCGS